MENKKIIFTTEKNISPADKGKLSKNGFIVIEVKSLSDIKYSEELNNDILLKSSMEALARNGESKTQARFFREVYRKLYPNALRIDAPNI